jgi:O-antigen/teichoic acid export membrane protein
LKDHQLSANLAVATDLKTRAFKGGAKLFLRQTSSKLIGLIANVLLARILMPQQYGIYAVVSSAIGLFNLMGDVGLGASLIRQPTKPTFEDEATVFTAQQICVAVPTLLVVLLAPSIAEIYKFSAETIWLIRFVAIAGLISSFGSMSRIQLERGMEFGPLTVIDATRSILFQVVAVSAAFAGAGIWSFAFASVASELSAVILSQHFSPWKICWRLDWDRLKERALFGLSYQGLNLFNFMRDSLNPFFIGAIYGASAVGIVGFAMNIANYPLLFSGIFYGIYFPAFARCQNDPAVLKELVETVLWWTNFLNIGITTVSLPLLGMLIPAVFGAKWGVAVPLAYLLLFANLMTGTTVVLIVLANAIGKPALTLRYSALLAICNWIVTVPLVLKLGTLGFGIGQILLMISNFLFLHKMKRMIEFDLYGSLTPFLLSFLISTSSVAFIIQATHATGWVAIITFGLFGLINFLTISTLVSRGKMLVRLTEMLQLIRA